MEDEKSVPRKALPFCTATERRWNRQAFVVVGVAESRKITERGPCTPYVSMAIGVKRMPGCPSKKGYLNFFRSSARLATVPAAIVNCAWC